MDSGLSKREKALAREIIQKGLQEDFKRGLSGFQSILQKQQVEENDLGEIYRELYKTVREFDKFIARRYDGLRPSDYDMVITAQLMDKLYDVSELDDFCDEVKQPILARIKNWSKD